MSRLSPTLVPAPVLAPALAPLLAATLALLWFTPDTAPAQAAEQADAAFARLDTDRDGAISREEFLMLRRQMFAVIDADADGFVTRAEIEAARAAGSGGMQPRRNSRVWQQDANGDGRLTRAEYTAQTRGFDFADRDGSGALSRSEFTRIARFLAPSQ